MATGAKRPIIMDGRYRFDSIRQAASYLKEEHQAKSQVSTIASNIWCAMKKPGGTVYGHRFQEDTFRAMTPKEYESIIQRQREALQKQHQLILYSRKNRAPLNQQAVLASEKLLNECGVDA